MGKKKLSLFSEINNMATQVETSYHVALIQSIHFLKMTEYKADINYLASKMQQQFLNSFLRLTPNVIHIYFF